MVDTRQSASVVDTWFVFGWVSDSAGIRIGFFFFFWLQQLQKHGMPGTGRSSNRINMPALRRRLEQQTLMPPQPQPRRRRLPSPSLMEELIEEILLRLPPQEPASLVRAALVCKSWRRLVSGPRFSRRFLDLHRPGTPPMLGFISNHSHGLLRRSSSFVRTSAFSPLPPPPPPLQSANASRSRWWSALDARHGHVLLRLGEGEGSPLTAPARVLVVWDPIADEQQQLPVLPRPTVDCTAAVFCSGATGGGGACDHRGYHRGPFRVVFVGTERWNMFIYTYSSDAAHHKWSGPISIQHPNYYDYHIFGGYSPSMLLGKNNQQLYFGIPTTNAALKYDVELRDKWWIQLPRLDYGLLTSVLIATDDGRLGLVRLNHGILCIWLRMEMDTDTADQAEGGNANAGWTKFKVIDLSRQLRTVRPSFIPEACVVGFAEGLGLGIVFVTLNKALYTVDLETSMVKKQTCMVEEEVRNGGEIQTVFPYMHFYSPSMNAVTSYHGTIGSTIP